MESANAERNAPTLLPEERRTLDILAAVLNGKPISARPNELSDPRFLRTVREQKVAPIVAYAAASDPRAFGEAAASKLAAELSFAIGLEVVQSQDFAALNAAFDDANVKYMPLKGFVMREYYPDPCLRSVGDYDVLVDREDLDKADEILAARGYVCQEKGEYHDVYFKKPNLVVELHFSLFGTSAAYRKVRSVAWERLVPYRGTQYRFTKEDFYRFMAEHLLKHWLVGETSLRDYFDVALYLRKFGPELDRAKLDADLESSGALEFVRNVERLTETWFDGKPSDPVLDEMTRYHFRPGAQAFYKPENQAERYANIIASGTTGAKRSFARLRYLRAQIFPKRGAVEIERALEGRSAIVKLCASPVLWCAFQVKRVFRKRFFSNAWALTRANAAKTSETIEFQRRCGLDPQKFNADDWTED